MEIEGPLIITVKKDEASSKHELHLTFKPGFINKKVFERIEALQNYIDQLKHHMQDFAVDNPDRVGMETVLQICENLLEYIGSDEIDLEQTIVIDIQPSIKLSQFLTDGSLLN